MQGPKLAALTPPANDLATPPATLSPSFDVVRVERDGSVVVAGRAPPKARVEVVNGTLVIGSTVSGPGGDFAVVVDEPLKPGVYQLKLRSTAPDDAVIDSQQVAVVAIPENKDGQLLVLVEQPGEPSRLVTVPEAVSSKSPAVASEQVEVAASTPTDLPVAPAGRSKVTVEAVEIEGRKIFLAGIADPGRKVRAYLDDAPLGDTVTSPTGRFLIEAERDVAVGNYMIHVEVTRAGWRQGDCTGYGALRTRARDRNCGRRPDRAGFSTQCERYDSGTESLPPLPTSLPQSSRMSRVP